MSSLGRVGEMSAKHLFWIRYIAFLVTVALVVTLIQFAIEHG